MINEFHYEPSMFFDFFLTINNQNPKITDKENVTTKYNLLISCPNDTPRNMAKNENKLIAKINVIMFLIISEYFPWFVRNILCSPNALIRGFQKGRDFCVFCKKS